MEITIIIDKSTFQSLNFAELYRLSCYYKHVITPVLTMEILGDLKKEFEEGKIPSEERVKDFANKLFPVETVVNLHYKILVKGDFLGNGPSMDGRPNVGIQKAVQSKGQKGFLIEESKEEKSVYKWKDGNFTEADRELSALWRMTTTQEDVLKRVKDSIKVESGLKLNDFQALGRYVDIILNRPESQLQLLLASMQNYEIDPATGLQILARWRRQNSPLIRDFAPFAYHCLKVDTLFSVGLAQGLISTRPTNRVDLEYFYYLPFCNIFTSNDKVQKNLVPLLLLPYQRFILGTELKTDLKAIVDHLAGLDIEELKKYKNQPPIIPDSYTFKLWEEFFDYPNKSNWNRDISLEEIEMTKQRMSEFQEAMEGDAIDFQGGDETDFIIKKSYLGKNDVCFCGSGKKVIDCCIPEEEFNKLADKARLKRQGNKDK
jgi:hypothetical protein